VKPTSNRLAEEVLLFIGSLLLLTSCGGGNSNAASTTPNLAGNWQMTLQRQDTTTIKTESGFLVQTGGSLTGEFLLTGATNCAGIGSAQGQISGSNVAITVAQVGQTVNLAGALGTNSAITGNYSILAAPCGSNQIGAWSATLVQPFSGKLQGAFASTYSSGFKFTFSGNVSQGPNTGTSSASLTGNMTSSDAPCFHSANLSGSISGTSIVLNLLSSEGVALGQIHGTTTAKATTTTAVYDFISPQSAPPNGCEDFGTVVITLN
jgi:hypothetical protein